MQANFSKRRSIYMQGETTPQKQAPLHHYTSVLFHHEPHQHQPRNANLLHEKEKAAAGFNTRLAVPLTKSARPMGRAYVFTLLAASGFLRLLGWLNPYTFL